jgi:hypothetical protein
MITTWPNSSVSANNLTPEAESEAAPSHEELFTLELPKPLTLTHEGMLRMTFVIPEYAQILRIFNAYQYLADDYHLKLKMLGVQALQLSNYKEQVKLGKATLSICLEDREHGYKLFEDSMESKRKEGRRDTFKTVLWTGGGAVVGAAIGIIVYAIIVN